ncbi:MAG: uracil-DNA glycosylase family protein [Taibaiella sp.]|nr:uracil-DNA glycosylase family protein [Taibaiella sp.]
MGEKSRFIYDMEDLKGVFITPADGIEKHPYEPFVPPTATVLILGSFPGVDQTRRANKADEWYYSAKRNQFWKILEAVYSVQLKSVADKMSLFNDVGIAITDVILKAKRINDSNLDNNLEIIEYNKDAIQLIINLERIKTVYFTSQFVQKHFLKLFPWYSNSECLPSPSPRYARMSLGKKIEIYNQKLPKK